MRASTTEQRRGLYSCQDRLPLTKVHTAGDVAEQTGGGATGQFARFSRLAGKQQYYVGSVDHSETNLGLELEVLRHGS